MIQRQELPSLLPVFDAEEGRHAVEGLRELAKARQIRQVGPRPSVCYAARGNSFVIRAKGRVNKCTAALEDPKNQVGHIEEDGTLRLQTDKMLLGMRSLRTGEAEALRCPMVGSADGAVSVGIAPLQVG